MIRQEVAGQEVTGPGVVRPPPVERRLLTLLFVDVSGYTQLTNTHDPEYVEQLVMPLLQELTAIALDHGAQVRPPQGDGFLAVFGATLTRDDDPRRAVRAAQEMRSRRDARARDDQALPGLHLGVASGEVLVRHGVDGLTGPAVNLAARLNDQAGSGEVLVDAGCVALCRAPEWFAPGQAFVLQGFPGPVVAHRLLPELPGEGLAPRTAPLTALLGRGPELDRLDRCWEEVVAGGVSQVVSLSGEAGVGKTALVETWLRRRAGELVLRADCRDYGHALPLGALTEAVLSLGGGRVEQVVSQLGATRAAAPARRLALLLGTGPEDRPRPREDDASLVDGLRSLLVELGRGGPLVLLLDDVHHAGTELRRVLTALDREPLAAPVLLLLCGRGTPALGEHLPVPGLALAATTALAEQVAGGAVDEDWVQEVQRRSGGNPLWVHELTALCLTEGQDRPGATLAPQQRTTAGDRVPAALQLIVTARLDRLPVADQEVLRRLAVVPEGLAPELLSAPQRVADLADLADLVEGGWLRQADGRVRIANAVVREVVYGSLSRRERALAHAERARDLDDPALRVHHLAACWQHSVDPDAAVGAARTALGSLLRWAEALAPLHVPSALEALARYSELRQVDVAPATRARLACLESESLLEVERRDQAEAAAFVALDLAQTADEPGPTYRARLALARALFVGGQAERAREEIAPVLAVTDLPPRWRGRALAVLGSTRSYDLTGYAADYVAAYDAFVEAGDDDGAADTARALAWFASMAAGADFGPWDARARALTPPSHLRGQALLARTRAMRAFATHDWSSCRTAAEESLHYARSVGSRDLEVWALTLLTEALLRLGDGAALRRADQELHELEVVGRPRQRLNALSLRYRALVRLGDRSAASDVRARLEELLRLLGPAERSQVATVDGEVAFDRGQWADAVEPFERAEWESVQLGWSLAAAEAALGALLARRRLGDADAPAGLLALADLYDSEDAPAAARLARAAAGRPAEGPPRSLAEAAWAAECDAIGVGSRAAWSAAARAWGLLGLSASYALCLERAGDTAEAARVRRSLTG